MDPPGCFLKEDKTNTTGTTWYEIDNAAALQKTRKALTGNITKRNCNPLTVKRPPIHTVGAMRNGEKDPYQDRRDYGRHTTNINKEASYQFHWLFRKRGRGRRGVTIVVTSFFVSILILNGMSSVRQQHLKMMLLNNYDNNSPIATTTDMNMNTNINERTISPCNSNKINTQKTTDTDDTTTSPTTNTTVRPTVPNIPSKLAPGEKQIEVVSNISNKLTLDKTQIALNNNGCGLQESSSAVPKLPMWINYTSEENERFDQVLECYNRLHYYTNKKMSDLDPFKSRLYCEMDGPPEIETVLSNYKRVWFIGDSVLYQTYLTLSCLAVPTLVRNEGFEEKSASFMYNHSMGSTEIRYTPSGLLYDLYELELYKLSFPDAISSSTKNDAIVVNAGLHYHHKDGPNLKRAAFFIANATTNATIYFMETTAETWPTSNGIFTPACYWFCECESLTDDRIVGNGSMVDSSSHHRNISGDLHLHHKVQQDKNLQHFYEPLIPHLTSFKKKNSSSYLYPYDRVPSYLPATWRNDITNPILNQSAHVKIVSLWWQLVASGKPHSRENGDCTHQSMVALIAMNEQLLRTMALPKSTDLSTSK